MLAVLILSNLVLIALIVLFIFKNMFINYIQSNSKLKSVILLFLIFSTLILSFSNEFHAIRMEERKSYLKNELLNNKDMILIGGDGRKFNYADDLQRQLDEEEDNLTKLSLYTYLGYLSLLCCWILDKSISHE